jgi:hypothetical protein
VAEGALRRRGGQPAGAGQPETDDVITVEFQRWELLGCTFELLQREAMADAADLVRRIRTELRVS